MSDAGLSADDPITESCVAITREVREGLTVFSAAVVDEEFRRLGKEETLRRLRGMFDQILQTIEEKA